MTLHNDENSFFTTCLVWSLLLHALVFLSTTNVKFIRPIDMELSKNAPTPIELIQREEKQPEVVTKINRPGIEGATGKSDLRGQSFSKKNSSSAKKVVNNSIEKSGDSKKFLESLVIDPKVNTPEKTLEVDEPETKKPEKELLQSQGRILKYSYVPQRKSLDYIAKRDLRDMTKSSLDRTGFLKYSKFSFAFDPPPGIPITKLNQLEQIFYGFRLRVSDRWEGAFQKSISDYVRMNPNVVKQFPQHQKSVQGQRMRGVIRFDKEGNVDRVKILKWVNNDVVQTIFHNSLVNIVAIPNLPKAFIEDREYFSMVFELEMR